jgi:hypothetical protein
MYMLWGTPQSFNCLPFADYGHIFSHVSVSASSDVLHCSKRKKWQTGGEYFCRTLREHLGTGSVDFGSFLYVSLYLTPAWALRNRLLERPLACSAIAIADTSFPPSGCWQRTPPSYCQHDRNPCRNSGLSPRLCRRDGDGGAVCWYRRRRACRGPSGQSAETSGMEKGGATPARQAERWKDGWFWMIREWTRLSGWGIRIDPQSEGRYRELGVSDGGVSGRRGPGQGINPAFVL